ncbi:hypothetical protein NO1_0868 [Candidatus Termititenax aidoneus]|uniref:Uncharacterized protein n=1 Tax=Termititenax aidoneus TaxID=2218524 RepID=A0A388TA15_TERA1|nr:hypothetical protein NO1_0868 [Candidatus Termititenax aidoneus]
MAPVSPSFKPKDYSLYDGQPPLGEFPEKIPLEETDFPAVDQLRAAEYAEAAYQSIYDFVQSGAAEKELRAELNKLVEDGALDPADAAALDNLFISPPNSLEDMVNRLPKFTPEEINKIAEVLNGRYFNFRHEEDQLNTILEGVGKISEIAAQKGIDGKTSEIKLVDTQISVLSSSDELGETNLNGGSAELSVTFNSDGRGGTKISGSDLRYTGESLGNTIKLEAESQEFNLTEDKSSARFDGLSVSGEHEETGVQWEFSADEISGETSAIQQSAAAQGADFSITKDEHQFKVSAPGISIIDNANSSEVNFFGEADAPALTAVYQNKENDLAASFTAGGFTLRTAAPLFSPEPFRSDYAFNIQDFRSRIDAIPVNIYIEELSGVQTENGATNILGKGLQAVGGPNSEWSGGIEKFSYAKDADQNTTINASELTFRYAENVRGGIGGFAFQYNPSQILNVDLQNTAGRAGDVDFSLNRISAQYDAPTNNGHVSLDGLAVRYGDYLLAVSGVRADYNDAAKRINFTAGNGALRGKIDLDKPLPPLPQDAALPEAWPSYLAALTENNITFEGSVKVGPFLAQNVRSGNTRHQAALNVVLPYLQDTSLRFDQQFVEYLMDDPDAEILPRLNENTDGFVGRQINQFVDAYLRFARNIYLQQQGSAWPEGYHRKFDLSSLLSPGDGSLEVSVAANPQDNYASAALNYSAPWFEWLGGYTHQPADANPALSILGLNYSAENILNSRFSLGPKFLRLNLDLALAFGQWRFGGESASSLLDLMAVYDLADWQPDEDKWWVKPLLDLPALPVANASVSSRIPLPFQTKLDSEFVWRPRLENYGHEYSLLENISWDNFWYNLSLVKEVTKGLSLKFEALLEINHLLSTPTVQTQKVSLLFDVKK